MDLINVVDYAHFSLHRSVLHIDFSNRLEMMAYEMKTGARLKSQEFNL